MRRLFVQAKLDDEIYVRMPRMFEREGYVLKLKKSVYGLHQAPLNFFQTLKQGLEDRGFTNSTLDPCLFISKDVICLCYVDDCLFFARDADSIDRVIDDLQSPNPAAFNADSIDRVIDDLHSPNPAAFKLKVESDVAGFLGILMQ
jgi:Reverse transcriptase (RNA-dependent DNA polymerase)